MKKTYNKYESYNHSKFRLRYHLIFSTKYRKSCLDIIKDSVYDVFTDISNRCNFKIECMGIDNNHIHFIIRSNPSTDVSSIVRRMKQISTRIIWDRHEEYLKQFYWKKRRIWTNGYFCSTIGEVSEDIVKEYIEKQG